MESKNILLVIISFSVLFVIIFGVGVMITWPKDSTDSEEKAFVTIEGEGWAVTPRPVTEAPSPEPGDIGINVESGEKLATSGEGEVEEKLSENDVAVGEEWEGKKESQPFKVNLTDVDKKTGSTLNRSSRKPATVVNKPVTRPSAYKKVTPKKSLPKRVTEYWIQAGSFKSMSSARLQNDKLENKGFPGQITTIEKNGSTYYRVRIGPYQEKNEAGKFLTWIKAIDDMSGSYISEVYVMR